VRSLLLVIVVLGAMAGPAPASAHSRARTTALDYRLRLQPMPPALAGMRAAVLDGDRSLRLSVPPSAALVVLGLAGEGFLRFAPGGVWVNGRSPTAAADKLVPARGRGGGWIRLTRANELTWHDHRLAPPANLAVGSSAPFALPVRVDGARAVIRGSFTRVARPAGWPWLLGAAAAVAALVAVARVRKRRGALAAVVAAVAAAAALAASAGFATGTSLSRLGDWVEVVSAAALAAGAFAVLCLAQPSTRSWAAMLIGPIAATLSLNSLAVFWHGVVVSALPATAARLSTGIAVLGGLAACVLGVLAAADEAEPRRRALAAPRTAVRR
jgi:hypothetical protein